MAGSRFGRRPPTSMSSAFGFIGAAIAQGFLPPSRDGCRSRPHLTFIFNEL